MTHVSTPRETDIADTIREALLLGGFHVAVELDDDGSFTMWGATGQFTIRVSEDV